jgi:hypothetical protein
MSHAVKVAANGKFVKAKIITGPCRARYAPGGSGGTAWKKKKGMEWKN